MMKSKPILISLTFALCYLLNAATATAQVNRTSTGVVMADRSVTLAAKIVGRIATVGVEEGHTVAAGQVLVDIDDAQLKAELASARAVLAQEQVRMDHTGKLDERYRSLYEQNSISLDRADEATFNYEVARTGVDRARADVATIEAALAETKITAPFAGVITSRTAEPGQVTSTGQPLLVLEDQATLIFRTRISETDIVHVELGQALPITIDALGELVLNGTISKIIPSGDISTHEFTVEATLPPQDKLLPGMFGKADMNY
jgi:RND family efflux transporter MFP subunit